MRSFETWSFTVCLSLTLLMSGCGGSSGVEAEPVAGPSEGPSEGPNAGPSEDPGIPEMSDVQFLGPGGTLTGQIAEGEISVIRVDSEAQMSLLSTVGDADLFILDDLNDSVIDELAAVGIYDYEGFLCRSTQGFKEDVCTASAVDGDMYAVVYGYADTQYDLTAIADCSAGTINEWAYRGLTDFYFYADQVPVVDPGSYADASEMIEALRFEPLDPFSNIQNAASQSAFFEEGVQFGLGQRWRRDSNDDLRINYVFADSPFGRAGVKRGDIAVTLGGEQLDETMSNQRFFELAGTQENPVVSDWTFVDGDTGQNKSVSVLIGEYEINTVLYDSHFEVPGFSGRIGYIVLSNFIEPSRDELNRVIDDFNAAGVTELVLDLRYNGGGRSFVSRQLASQIGGARVQGNTFARFEHNSTYADFDFEEQFPEALPELGLDRLVVLTTGNTASASESLINTLRPYMEVTTIGDASLGKAFRSYSRQFCGTSLNLMQVQGVNTAGVSVAGGIPADCFAVDDTTRNFGMESGETEAMLGKGLDYLTLGSCDSPPVIARRAQSKSVPPTHEPLYVGGDDVVATGK